MKTPDTQNARPPAEVIEVASLKVACDGDGGGGAAGHPRVFLNMKDGAVDCPYCDRRYVLKAGAHAAAH